MTIFYVYPFEICVRYVCIYIYIFELPQFQKMLLKACFLFAAADAVRVVKVSYPNTPL